MGKKNHRNYSPEFKVKLLRKHLVDKVTVSSICEENNIKPSLFYKWQNELFNSGNLIFENIKPDKIHCRYQKQIQSLENKLVKKNEVLAELMQEYVSLKKEYGEE
ncbi:MAG: transposase [Promethearchaeota archaeon]|jgi:transposase-like protein